jgi:hypothetical protein
MKAIFVLFVGCSAVLVGCFPRPDFLEGMDSDRAMRFKKAKAVTTVKPTWRPWYNHSRAEIEESMIDRDEPDGFFTDDYYDNYDSEVEGTRRNILAHGTFEDRVKTYLEIKRKQKENLPAPDNVFKGFQVSPGGRKKSTGSRTTGDESSSGVVGINPVQGFLKSVGIGSIF